jgi:hypothetical protein
MICAIAACALVVGGATCQPKAPQAVLYAEVLERVECVALVDFIRHVGPQNGTSLRRFEYYRPEK